MDSWPPTWVGLVEEPDGQDFEEIQLSHVRRFRAHHPDGERARVSQGLVVIPTDSATAGQLADRDTTTRAWCGCRSGRAG